MPSPRAAYGRDYTAVRVEVDAKTRDANAYQNVRRSGNSGPFSGKPVRLRNGLPVKLRAVTDTLDCGCVRRLLPAVMDWELITPCGGHHA